MIVGRYLAGVALACLIAGCTAGKGDKRAIEPSEIDATQPVAQGDAVAATGAEATPPAAGNPDEMLAPRSSFAGYGVESYRLVSDKDEIVSVLRNGMVVIVKRIASPVVAVRGVALTGGIYEKQWLGGGLSHLLEHLVAGGSSQRRTEAENRDLLQKIGNNSNAYTTEDNTSFFINTTVDHMEQAVDLVTGWMLGAKITVPEYKREYQVVQRELEMGKGQPDRQFYYLYAMNRYHLSPARVPVIGYQEVIQRLSRDDVYAYYKMAYQPNNIVFAVAGNMEPEKMLAAVQKNVAGAPPGLVFSHNIEAEPPVLTPRTLVCTFPKLGQARLMLGFSSVSSNSNEMYALDVLAAVLGGGESSTMIQELRDKQQLVSGISVSDDTPPYAAGTFDVEMLLDPEKVQPATEAALQMLEAVKTGGVDDDHLARAKMQIRSARVKRLQTAEEVAASLADDYRTTGDVNFSDRYVDRCEKVTSAQIKAVAKKYFDRSRLITTAMFPSEWAGAKGLPGVEDILRPAGSISHPAEAQEPVASAVERSVLDNGTILLVKRIASSPTVEMTTYSLGGVTAETEKTNGLGNLTMQMLTRGTKTRSAEEIAGFFDSTGGEIVAGCDKNTWYWSANCLKGDFEKSMEVYADVVNNPAFPDGEVGPMKKRIEAGIKGEDADLSQQAIRFFKKKYYGPANSPYQFLPEGTIENVESFSADQVRAFYDGQILRSRRVLAIYGNVDPAKAKSLAASLLGKSAGPNDRKTVAESEGAPEASPPVPAETTASVNVDRVEVQRTEQEGIAGVVIGFKANTIIGGSDWYDFAMAKTLTGGYTYPTGYLFETLRGKGLVYVVDSQNSAGLNARLPGTFLVFAECDPARVNEVVDLCLENIARLQGNENDINTTWYNRAKELITVADAMEHETPAAQGSTAAINELYGLGYAWQDQFADKIRAVSLPAVQALARRKLRECVVTISTPSPNAVRIKPGMRNYESFPPVDLTPRGVQHDTGAAGPK